MNLSSTEHGDISELLLSPSLLHNSTEAMVNVQDCLKSLICEQCLCVVFLSFVCVSVWMHMCVYVTDFMFVYCLLEAKAVWDTWQLIILLHSHSPWSVTIVMQKTDWLSVLLAQHKAHRWLTLHGCTVILYYTLFFLHRTQQLKCCFSHMKGFIHLKKSKRCNITAAGCKINVKKTFVR